MRRDQFVAEREARWRELDGLVQSAGRRPERLGADGVRALGTQYRALAADLAHARLHYPGDPIVERLDGLTRRARATVYARPPERGGFRHFVTTGFWRRVRERSRFLALSAALLFGMWALVGVWSWRNPDAALGAMPAQFQQWAEPQGDTPAPTSEESAAFASQLYTNNIQVALVAVATGVAAGIGPALSMIFNGLVLGAVSGVAIRAGNGRLLLEWIPAHGLLELSCFIVAGAAGMRLGWTLLAPGLRSRGEALRTEARAATEIALGVATWLVLAGVLEAFVSPSDASLATRVIVGGVVGVTFWVLVAWRGRPEPAAVGI